MRGEHSPEIAPSGLKTGSSPHARGARTDTAKLDSLLGIIPACAGSTHDSRAESHNGWDHPRMRGEHFRHKETGVVKDGSSPHARGALA